MPSLYTEVKESTVKPKLSEMQYYSATMDLWTSRASHPYLSFTVHFIDCSWELQSFCLETVPLFEDHTGENIIDSLLDVMANWVLSLENLVVTTTDNGSNFVAGFRAHGEA